MGLEGASLQARSSRANKSLTNAWDTRGIRGIVVTVVTVVALAALAAGSASASGAVEPSLFPLARAAWTLGDENGNTLRIRSTRAASSYVLHGFPGFASLRVRAVGRDVQAWDARVAEWRPFLRLGATAGTRYRVDLAASPLWRSLEVVVSRSTCEVGMRTIRGCVTLELRARRPVADAGVERLVFAPGVGPVEVVVQTIAGPRTYALDRTGPSLS